MEKEQLIKRLLFESFDEIQLLYFKQGRIHWITGVRLKEVVDLSIVLNLKELERKSSELLKNCFLADPDESMVTNMPKRTKSQKEKYENRVREIKNIDELKVKYRVKSKLDYLKEFERDDFLNFKLLKEGKYLDAVKSANSQLEVEDIAAMLLVMNKFEEAEIVIENYLYEVWMIVGMKIIKIIEYARVGKWKKALQIFKKMKLSNFKGISTKLELVKGLNEMDAWEGYPFADY